MTRQPRTGAHRPDGPPTGREVLAATAAVLLLLLALAFVGGIEGPS